MSAENRGPTTDDTDLLPRLLYDFWIGTGFSNYHRNEFFPFSSTSIINSRPLILACNNTFPLTMQPTSRKVFTGLSRCRTGPPTSASCFATHGQDTYSTSRRLSSSECVVIHIPRLPVTRLNGLIFDCFFFVLLLAGCGDPNQAAL
jgi:hypothetical protein